MASRIKLCRGAAPKAAACVFAWLAIASRLVESAPPDSTLAVADLGVESAHAVSGTVVDERGEPIEGVRVEAFTPVVGVHSSFSMPTGRDRFPGADRVDTTDRQGRFRIADLPSGEVQLNLQAKHRHVSDDNYPVRDGLRIVMSGSGKPGVIQGRIVEAATGRPPSETGSIRIVRRHSPKEYDCTNDDGRFELPAEVTSGEDYVVYVYAKRYAATEARLTAVSPDSNEYTEIKLHDGPLLRGKMVDADTGRPVAGAAILYGVADNARYFEWSSIDKYADGYHSLNFVQHDVSSKTGRFWFAEPAAGSQGTIIALIDGYQRLFLKPEGRQIDAATGELIIALQRESAFTGIVRKNGKPLPNVSVRVIPRSEDRFHHMQESVRTDAEGKYRYGRLAPGRYFVSGGPYTRIATIGKADISTVNLGEGLGPIRINGKATPRASITLHPDFDWDYNSLEAKANAAGEYEISGLRPGKYRVWSYRAHSTGYFQNEQLSIEVRDDGQRIDLTRRPDSKPLPRIATESDAD